MENFICNIVCLYLRNGSNKRNIEKNFFSNTCYNYFNNEYLNIDETSLNRSIDNLDNTTSCYKEIKIKKKFYFEIVV